MKTFKELRRSLGYPVFKEEEQRNLKSTIVLGEEKKTNKYVAIKIINKKDLM